MTQTSSPHMKLGLVLNINEGALQGKTPTFSDLREMAQVAEQVGFDSLWLPDHLISRFPGQAERGIWEAFTMLVQYPQTDQKKHPRPTSSSRALVYTGKPKRSIGLALGALAAVTQRIMLGPLVACTSFRDPALLAKMADTLDRQVVRVLICRGYCRRRQEILNSYQEDLCAKGTKENGGSHILLCAFCILNICTRSTTKHQAKMYLDLLPITQPPPEGFAP